ncbi:hypothetical protein RRG08_036572 [Elysia crispata]|uniref:Uncharacterized protein n=1 Tax=Elysia crispata TaxID=231223 RepID=A0AAE1DKJ9_9GAST|nr:hypothetical protein RRG08_036572 [Elysia crispata]
MGDWARKQAGGHKVTSPGQGQGNEIGGRKLPLGVKASQHRLKNVRLWLSRSITVPSAHAWTSESGAQNPTNLDAEDRSRDPNMAFSEGIDLTEVVKTELSFGDTCPQGIYRASWGSGITRLIQPGDDWKVYAGKIFSISLTKQTWRIAWHHTQGRRAADFAPDLTPMAREVKSRRKSSSADSQKVAELINQNCPGRGKRPNGFSRSSRKCTERNSFGNNPMWIL